jgi:hypothetical protein
MTHEASDVKFVRTSSYENRENIVGIFIDAWNSAEGSRKIISAT